MDDKYPVENILRIHEEKILRLCGAKGLEYYKNLSKREAIEINTVKLFEGFDIRTDEAPNPNPHECQISGFTRKIDSILREHCTITKRPYKPNAFVSIYDFQVYWCRKNGIHKDYWEYDDKDIVT